MNGVSLPMSFSFFDSKMVAKGVTGLYYCIAQKGCILVLLNNRGNTLRVKFEGVR